jgi:C1A family cysteine protease
MFSSPIVSVSYNQTKKVRTGWQPDIFDPRDFGERSKLIEPTAQKLSVLDVKAESLPGKVEFFDYCGDMDDQGSLGSCVAFGVLNHVECMQALATGKYIRGSRLALYKIMRNLMHVAGDTGAWNRIAFQALRLFGLPLEEYWEYDINRFDEEVTAFALGTGFNAISNLNYFRHDTKELPQECIPSSIKKWMAAGVTCVGAFYGCSNFNRGARPGDIPMPRNNEQPKWGHSVHFCGYDDDYEIVDIDTGNSTKGALFIENSWGRDVGDNGFYALPYQYIMAGYGRDYWSLIDHEWVELDEFGISV